MSKLAENAYRDLNIAYANEISMICDDLKINPYNLIHLSNKHPRVNILNPGPGVGGHCIAVDPWFIVSNNPKKSQLIQAARRVNEKKKDWVIKKIANQASKIKKKKISISFYGITYKPNSDDFRESPALEIVRNFSKKSNIECLIVEPNLKKLPNEISGCLKTNLNESKI